MSALVAKSNNPPPGTLADDTLCGAKEIANFIGDTVRQTNYNLEKSRLPAFKVGNTWRMRKSTYLAHIERLETAAMQRCVAA